MCTLLVLSQLNPSSLPDPQPDFRISLSLYSLCVPLVSARVPPTNSPSGARTHLHHVHSLSTNWRLLGSDRDTKTKLGTNPSKPNYLVQTTWSQDRHLRTTCSHTPARPAPSFSLCFGSAHLVFPWPPPSLFLFDCNARNYPFSHSHVLGHCFAHVPRALLITRCDVPTAPSRSTIRRPNSTCCSHNGLDIIPATGLLGQTRDAPINYCHALHHTPMT